MLDPIHVKLSDQWQLTGLPAFSDNWIWLIYTHGGAWAIDPGDASPVLNWCKQHPEFPLKGILVTHKHHDHIGGIPGLLSYADLDIWAPANYSWPFQHHPVNDQEPLKITTSSTTLTLHALHIPGHTLEHVAYVLPELRILFCGDTLFSLGCGRMFEGTPEQFWTSLSRLKILPDAYYIACAHEYTLNNARFAVAVEPSSLDIQKFLNWCTHQHNQNKSTLPSTLKIEQQLNPFLRCDQPIIRKAAESWAQHDLNKPSEVFATLRSWKDNF